ncbi:hypothetical protein B0T19DRAFT_423676 [Cercophora scortea]|uniref:Uncharacterized protein n=1 Tax=Cercophora scortea TaxID=314031 RepID=A0AAE0IMV1_9PEZI|nr:hypothetical protein B0T19DRAFT_423676 [Cercophora scortea]
MSDILKKPRFARYNNLRDRLSNRFALAHLGDPHSPDCETLSLPEAQRLAKERSIKIITAFSKLSEIIGRHEGTIQRRWMKKTRTHRLRILLKAWPSMPKMHRPDTKAYHNELSHSGTEIASESRQAYLWPYINQEDLSDPRHFLLLLNARGRNPPKAFSYVDLDAAFYGYFWEGLGARVVPDGHKIILNSVPVADARNYAMVIPCGLLGEGNIIGSYHMPGDHEFCPADGLMILEVQERLMAFLVECCEDILHDIPTPFLVSDAFPVQPEPQLQADSDTSGPGSESFLTIATEYPYRLPVLDVDWIDSVLTAKVTGVEDHFWALREDPGYFAEQLQESTDHLAPEMFMEHAARLKEGPPPHNSEGASIYRAFLEVFCYLHFELENFRHLHERFCTFKALHRKYCPNNTVPAFAPEEYIHAVLRFRHCLEMTIGHSVRRFLLEVMASPSLRCFFKTANEQDIKDMYNITVKDKIQLSLAKTKTEFALLWVLVRIGCYQVQSSCRGLCVYLDELERLVQTDEEAKRLISPRLARLVGGLSIMAQCWNQLEVSQLRRWFLDCPDFDHVEYLEANRFDNQVFDQTMSMLPAFVKIIKLSITTQLGWLERVDTYYPVGQRLTKNVVNRLQYAENELDKFWARFSRAMAKDEPLAGGALFRLLSQPRVLQRTPKWVEPTRAEPKKKSTSVQDVDTSLGNLTIANFRGEFDTSSNAFKKSDISLRNVKSKTRGIAHQTPSPQVEKSGTSAEVDSETQQEAQQPGQTFSVNARALKVFRTLFYNPSTTSTPGEVAWNDFLHAMTSMGFAVEKLYGSVWQFRPTRHGITRPIQFHEPHPKGKIAYRHARRHGRRLRNAYYWSGDMFVLLEGKARDESMGELE